MTPDAKLRMEIYQEGQRAFNKDEACPYSDWRAGTWTKGWEAARNHSQTQMLEQALEPTPFPMSAYFRDEDELRHFVGQHRHLLEP